MMRLQTHKFNYMNITAGEMTVKFVVECRWESQEVEEVRTVADSKLEAAKREYS